jgi:hypothetical protein
MKTKLDHAICTIVELGGGEASSSCSRSSIVGNTTGKMGGKDLRLVLVLEDIADLSEDLLDSVAGGDIGLGSGSAASSGRSSKRACFPGEGGEKVRWGEAGNGA